LSLFFLCYNPCSLPQLFFPPLFIHSLPLSLLPTLTFPNLSPHYLSFLHAYQALISLLYQPYIPPPSEIPVTSTLHHNSRTTYK
jgi:hypothetical protein